MRRVKGESMKQFLYVCLICAVIYAAGCLFGTGVFAAYTDSLLLSAGNGLPAVSAATVFEGFGLSLMAVSFLAPAVLAFYCIRKRFTGPRTAAYIVCSLVSWFVLLPAGSMLTASSAQYVNTESHTVPAVTEGYLRRFDGAIVYYSHISADGRGDGIVIRVPHEGASFAPSVQILDAVQAVSGNPLPFSDVLIQRSVSRPGLLDAMQRAGAELFRAARAAGSGGWASWLTFASIFIPLLALPCVGYLSRWPLLSVVYMTFGFVFVCAVNILITAPASVLTITQSAFLEHLLLSATPLVHILINVCMSMLFVLSGIVSSFLHTEAVLE